VVKGRLGEDGEGESGGDGEEPMEGVGSDGGEGYSEGDGGDFVDESKELEGESEENVEDSFEKSEQGMILFG
jgi:hypothetical protein